MDLKDIIQNLKMISDRQKLRSKVGIKLEQSRNYKVEKIETTVFATNDNIFFLYITADFPKITKKTVKFLLDKSHELGNDLTNAKYLILIVQKQEDSLVVGIDLVNRNNPKITTFHIDMKGTFNIDENKIKFKNRTILEQLKELSKDIDGGARELKVRYIKRFFEKQKLTEDFYIIYKTELFDRIKKNLTDKYGKIDENTINNFVLINLNRLLFIHFLDKKQGIFPDYDKKYGSYISYLFHKVYKDLNTEKSFYEAVLKVLFFEVFNKSQFDRKIAHDKVLFEEFYNLPYLNGGLFKPIKCELHEKYFIDNVFVKVFITKIIDQFNFTITEDTPFDVKVSVDPELLGYIFENLIQDYDNSKDKKDDERSKGGIFYTPKIEVDFMCRQALIEYLTKKEELKTLKAPLYQLIYAEKGGIEEQQYGSFNSHQIGFIFKYLEEIKVVDPACGSGAFLVGMMQVILDIENTLLQHFKWNIEHSSHPLVKAINEKNTFQRKKQLIKNSLHGVDIKSRAVDIAKLRLWLSMIVDIDTTVFAKDSVKTEPLLPSFGFKVVQGDSLVNRIGDKLIPIDIARKDILEKKTRDKIEELVQLKSEFYDNKHKDEYIVRKKEQEIYESILGNKITYIKGQITKLEQIKSSNSTDSSLFGKPEFGKEYKTENLDTKKLDKNIEDYKAQIELLTKQLQDITLHGQLPFARGIDFSEVFTENGGFDVVVGNPPYVRQEAIEDPTGAIKDKKDYKNLLVDVVNQDRFDDIKKYKKDELKIGGRSDLYLYFYFRGLKLLNEQGVFTFITSNSWLDVDFGAILQEFLIKYCPSIKVFDNQVQRSFASASVNTIMCFFDKPIIDNKEIMTGKAQFINFNKPYEESIWTETMAELNHQVINKNFSSKEIKTGEVVFTKRTTDELRVIDIDARNLWLDGSESIGNEGLETRKYEGNKRGGKFLRAPEIFFTILERGGKRINKLGNLFSSTQRNTLQPFEKTEEINIVGKSTIPFLNSSKSAHSIRIQDFSCYVDIDKSNKKKSWQGDIIQKPDIISNRFIGERMFFIEGGNFLVGDTFFVGFLKDNSKKKNLLLLLNSTLSIFFVEMIGRKNMGEGVLLLYGPEFNQLPIYETDLKNKYLSENSFINREVNSIFDELGLKKHLDITNQIPNPLPDRKELDNIIFDELGLTQEEKNEVYRSLAELVKARGDKAKSV